MTTYAKRRLKYSRNENFNLLHYVEWDRIVTLTGATSGLRVMLSYLVNYEEDKNKVPMNIKNTNICNGIFHISFFKALLINEDETTRG